MKKKWDPWRFFTETLLHPMAWTTPWRRMFLITIPVSGPVWCLYGTVFVIAALIVVVVLHPVLWAISMWTGEDITK